MVHVRTCACSVWRELEEGEVHLGAYKREMHL